MRKHLPYRLPFVALLFLLPFALYAQTTTLSKEQQAADFAVFRGGLKEGHGGLYYFIDSSTFARKADSISRTFTNKATVDAYYLKLRYLLSLLGHGHSRIKLPADGGTNYKMAVLQKNRLYLPLELRIINKKVYATADCSAEQAVPKGEEIVRINGKSATGLVSAMLPYLSADGKNQTFKYYFLYNYYYFHFLYNLLNPSTSVFRLELASGRKVSVKGRTPVDIEKTFAERNGKSISSFENPINYNPTVAPNTAYLKVGSFYKGFIESFGTRYEPFIDSVFKDLNKRQTPNLVLDLRNNEGGGDHYNDILFAYISPKPFLAFGFDRVPGKSFPFAKYAINLTDDLKAFIADPRPFLRDDTSLLLKGEYTEGTGFMHPAPATYKGTIYVLTNGGTFSAGNTMVQLLDHYRNQTGHPVYFVGEENGGDVSARFQCAGISYIIKLPNSGITVDMPFLCSEQLSPASPTKTLPDYKVDEAIKDVVSGGDTVLQFVINHIKSTKAKR